MVAACGFYSHVPTRDPLDERLVGAVSMYIKQRCREERERDALSALLL